MKYNKQYKSWIVSLTLITVLSIFLTSCLKDKGPVEDYSKSPALVGFQYSGATARPFTVSILGQSTDTFALEVALSVASLTLNQAVTVTIVPDPPGLANYNTENGTNYV